MPVAPKSESGCSNLRAKPYTQDSQHMRLPDWRLTTHVSSPTSDARNFMYRFGRGMDGYPEVRDFDKTLNTTAESSFKISELGGEMTYDGQSFWHIEPEWNLNRQNSVLELKPNNIEFMENPCGDGDTIERSDRRIGTDSKSAISLYPVSRSSPKPPEEKVYEEDSCDWGFDSMIFPELPFPGLDESLSVDLWWGSKNCDIRPRIALEPSSRALAIGGHLNRSMRGINSQRCLSPIIPAPETTAKIRPAFGLKFPFDRLPYFITSGFGLLKKLYTNHYAASCIVDCIRNLELVVDLQDPAVELALIMVTVLGCPTPLPKVVDGDFQRHTKYGREKTKWRAVLFIKMMWYRYPSLMTAEVKERFTSYQGQQTITSLFLLRIGWVACGAQPGSRPNKQTRKDLKLIPEGAIRRKLEKYKKLITAGDSFGLARKIFDRDDTWAGMALDGRYYI